MNLMIKRHLFNTSSITMATELTAQHGNKSATKHGGWKIFAALETVLVATHRGDSRGPQRCFPALPITRHRSCCSDGRTAFTVTAGQSLGCIYKAGLTTLKGSSKRGQQSWPHVPGNMAFQLSK